MFGSLKESLDYGDAAWSKILSNWATVKETGADEARELVARGVRAGVSPRRACSPTPTVLAFDETYEGKRADLKDVGEGLSG